jgi:NAD(P)-dependent dehydrogenase (short-subunit alcohol dehydrogenase family)/acyl carrier protein
VKSNESSYIINRRARDDYFTLLRELREPGQLPDVIVHLWSVTGSEDLTSDIDSFDALQSCGFESLLFLAQALGEEPGTSPLRLGVVSNRMQAITGNEAIQPSKATLLGPCKVIPEEFPNIACRSIDIELARENGPESEITGQLLAELTALSPDDVVAYRGKHRWVQTFESVRLGKATDDTPTFKENGVYLITGGLGGIGLAIAEHLAKSVRAKLVLLGRTEFPASDTWTHWLETQADSDPVSMKIRTLETLKAAGAEVMVTSCDVADLEGMRVVVKRINQHFGKIDGVIHSAGVAGGRLIQLQTPEETSKVISPKARGTIVLDAVLKDQAMDFFVLCSSLNGIQGVLGQVDYCGANAFLDAFAHAAGSRAGHKVVSINWDTWQEVGMAVNTVVPRGMEEMKSESLKQGILSTEGIEVLTRIVSTNLPQVAVSTVSLLDVMERDRNDATTAAEQATEDQQLEIGQVYARPSLVNEYVAPVDDVELNLASTWQELLGVEQVGIHDNFFELGGHSLLAIQIVSRLRESFNIELSIRHFFESPTIAMLAQIIQRSRESASEENDQISRMVKLVEDLSEEEIAVLLADTDLSVRELNK